MNTATSLNDIAQAFETFASDQRAMISRQHTKRDKADCVTRASVWEDAADTLRNTRIDPELIRQLKWMDPAFPARFRREDWLELVEKIEAAFTGTPRRLARANRKDRSGIYRDAEP